MAVGDTCFLCEVGSNYVVLPSGVRAVRADGVGTCATCHVHACPQHGDRYNGSFRCADCLGQMGVSRLLGGGGGAGDEDPPDAPDHGSGVSTRRLLAIHDAEVTGRDVERLRTGLAQSPALSAKLDEWLEDVPAPVLWAALGLRVPRRRRTEREVRERVFDPHDPRELVLRQVAWLEEAAREFPFSRAEEVDWSELALYVALPVVARGASLGASLVWIPGGLLLPPIVAVLAQAHADADVD